MEHWILTIVIFLPLVGAISILLREDRNQSDIAWAALGWSLLTLVAAIWTVFLFLGTDAASHGGFALEQTVSWIGKTDSTSSLLGRLKISYHVGVDGISLALLLLTSLLSPIAIAASFSGIRARLREYYALLLILQTAMSGVFCSLDLLLFYVFFEFTLIPLYFIIGIWGGPLRQKAAMKFFVYTLSGSVLTFTGIVYLVYYLHSRQPAGSVITFDLPQLYQLAHECGIPASLQWWLFVAFAAGFAVKVPLFPLHTWLPLAHTEAPTAGSVILAGILLKLGTYGFLRLSIPLLSEAARQLAPTMAVLAIMGILYGALTAWVQTDVKKLVAYSSVSHLGFCILGMFSLKMAGLSGSVLYMVNHGLSTGALFLMVGMIYERYHTRQIDAIGGLARPMPWLAFFLIFFTLSSIGLPGLNGFVGEFLVLFGTALSPTTYDGFPVGQLGFSYAAVAAIGIILGAVYMLWMCQRVLFGPLKEPPRTPDLSATRSKDLNRREIAILVPIAMACLWIGLVPRSLQNSIEPSIRTNIMQASMGNSAGEDNSCPDLSDSDCDSISIDLNSGADQ